MTSHTPLLQVRSLGIGHGPRRVLSEVSFSLQRGELLCLLGPNGSGKTTLLRTLLGLLPPQSGEVRLLDRPLSEWSRKALARHIGYVPQAHAGLFAFTVLDIVLMGRAAHVGRFAAPSAKDRAIAMQCLETLGIAALAECIYTQVSGGERQLVVLARALAQEPRVLLLDEPTAHLDLGNKGRVLELVRQQAEAGATVIFTTHEPDLVGTLADNVVLMRAGQALAAGPLDEVFTGENLSRTYNVPVHVLQVEGKRFIVT